MTVTGSILPVSAAPTEPLAVPSHSRAVACLSSVPMAEDGHHDHEDEQHHGHEARREVIAVIDIGIEQYVPAEPHGHQLRHGLLLAEPLFGEQL